MCNCLDLANEKLADKNTQVELIWGLGDKGGLAVRMGVRTVKIDSKKRGRPITLLASFCPFCGEQHYGPSNTSCPDASFPETK